MFLCHRVREFVAVITRLSIMLTSLTSSLVSAPRSIMATALCDFGCSGTVELPAPDAMGHNCPVHTAKAFEAFSVFLRPQQWKNALGTDGPFFSDNVLGNLVLGIAAGTDQMRRVTWPPGSALLSEWGFGYGHMTSGGL